MKHPILDGIYWTGYRHMMQTPNLEDAKRYAGLVKQTAGRFDKKGREHTARDIRQNVVWRDHLPIEVKKVWIDLAAWLDGEEKPKAKATPKRRIDPVWFEFIKHSWCYIMHSRSYSVSYADDIAGLYPLMSTEQRTILFDIAGNIRQDDDLCCRKLAALLDPDNLYIVHYEETAEKIREWAERRGVSIGNPVDIKADCVCFCVDGRYYDVNRYCQLQGGAGSLIPDFITNVEKI